MFLLIGTCSKQKETSLLTLCMTNFGFTATSFFKIWTPARSSVSTNRFHRGIFFLFLTEGYSFSLIWACLFFFHYSNKDYLPLLIFP